MGLGSIPSYPWLPIHALQRWTVGDLEEAAGVLERKAEGGSIPAGSGKWWSDSGQILKVEPSRFPNRLDVGVKGKGDEIHYKVFEGLRNRNRVVMGRPWQEVSVRKIRNGV